MEALSPCNDCSRHIRSSASDCPFCGAPRVAPVAPPAAAPRVGRLTRAAIFAGAALIMPACGGATATETQDTTTPPPLDDGTADDEAEQRAARDAEQLRLEEEARANDDDNQIQARPYGAPPRRDDFV